MGLLNTDEQPAFGFFPQMKPRRSKQDPEAAKNAPVDLARGFVAGTWGAPGDLEALVRMATGGKQILPTSSYIESKLPFKSDTPVSNAAAGLGQLLGGFYTGPGSGVRAITSTAGAVKRAAQDFVGAAGNSVSPMIVWHGSPHKFTKFDSSKIGTGEGAQAYGHGLYMAESPEVAGAYRKNLSKDTFVSPNGSVINRAKLSDFGFEKSDIDVMLGAIQRHDGDFLAAADAMASHRPTAAKFLKGIGQQGAINEGSLYKVDLPDPLIARMLDWDKPLSQQGEAVQRAISPMLAEKRSLYPNLDKDPTGNVLYTMIGGNVGSTAQAQSARALREAGIPGIRYLDGGSRNISQQVQTAMDGLEYWKKVGDPAKIAQAERVLANAQKMNGFGTSNFVIFPGEESALTILERNGQPLGLLDVR